MLVHGKNCTWPKNTEQLGQTDLWSWYLAEDGHQGGDIENAFAIWQRRTGVRGCIPDVPKAMPGKLPARFREHFRLQVEQLQTAERNASREFNTEVPGTRADLEHATVRRQRQAIRKSRRADDDTPDGIVDQPRCLVRKVSATERTSQNAPNVTNRHVYPFLETARAASRETSPRHFGCKRRSSDFLDARGVELLNRRTPDECLHQIPRARTVDLVTRVTGRDLAAVGQ